MNNDLTKDTAAARELFYSFDGMEGLATDEAPAQAKKRTVWQTAVAVYPGVLTALTIGLAATWLSQHYGAPVMLFALLIGMSFHFLHEEGRCVAGIEFSSKLILRLGVALLGARITASQIASLGIAPIALVAVSVATTILFGYVAARSLKLTPAFGALSGGSVAICGASAALAIASVLPRTRDSERDTILTVVTVTALSTIAMIIYPMIATALHLDHAKAGVFLGGTIHDVAQVVGAGYTISQETGDVATYVKLLRVAMLLPAVFVIAYVVARATHRGGKSAPVPGVPLFLIGFAALVAINSLGMLPKVAADGLTDVSRWLLVTAIAALGMKTSFKELFAVGWRPIALVVAETFWIGLMVLGVVYFWL
ncbi:MAG: YeiH family putative sulfate export transporter [Hyphomonadaceae bacterium]|nr:YeiH family putative sulfate export transporter [Hyphomonadaceae bacterium]